MLNLFSSYLSFLKDEGKEESKKQCISCILKKLTTIELKIFETRTLRFPISFWNVHEKISAKFYL